MATAFERKTGVRVAKTRKSAGETYALIAGKVRKWRSNLVGVDVARVLRLVEEARDGVVRRSGFTMNRLG